MLRSIDYQKVDNAGDMPFSYKQQYLAAQDNGAW